MGNCSDSLTLFKINETLLRPNPALTSRDSANTKYSCNCCSSYKMCVLQARHNLVKLPILVTANVVHGWFLLAEMENVG